MDDNVDAVYDETVEETEEERGGSLLPEKEQQGSQRRARLTNLDLILCGKLMIAEQELMGPEDNTFDAWMNQCCWADVGPSKEDLQSLAKQICDDSWRSRDQNLKPLAPLAAPSKRCNDNGSIDDIVNWQGVSVDWLLNIFLRTPEMTRLKEFQCPMWFVRNFCVTEILRRRGVQSGCVANHMGKFSNAGDGREQLSNAGNETTSQNGYYSGDANIFISYTGSRSLFDFVSHLKHQDMKGKYVWTDVLCVDQFAWTTRTDEKMTEFKDRFMTQLKDRISQIGHTVLLLDRWSDVESTLGKVWVIWEMFATADGGSALNVHFAQDEKGKFFLDYFYDFKGIHKGGAEHLFKALGKVDAAAAESFDPKDKDVVVKSMEQDGNGGITRVNKLVTEKMRQWLVSTIRDLYDVLENSGQGEASKIALVLAAMYTEIGSLDEAVHFAQIAYTKSILVSDSTQTMNTLLTFSTIMHAQGKFKEAVDLTRMMLDTTKAILGTHNETTYWVMNNLAAHLEKLHEFEEAETLLREALSGLLQLAPGSRHTWSVMYMLAVVLIGQGKNLDEAGRLHLESLEKRRACLGPRHPDTLESINSLAALTAVRGNKDKTEPLIRYSLVATREIWGDTHPATLSKLNNLAVLLMDIEQYEEGESWCCEALAGCRETLGVTHPETLRSVTILLTMFERQNKLSEAEPWFREVVSDFQSAFGISHLETLHAMTTFGEILVDGDELDEAETFFHLVLTSTKASRTDETLVANDSRKLVILESKCLELLANLFRIKGDFLTAERMSREALEQICHFKGNADIMALNAMASLAGILEEKGDIDGSISLLDQALAGFKETVGDTDDETLKCMTRLAVLLQQEGKRLVEAEALCVHVRSASMSKEQDGCPINSTAVVLLLASRRESQGDHAGAEKYLREAVTRLRHENGNNDANTCSVLFRLSSTLIEQQKPTEAETFLREALGGFRSAEGNTSLRTMIVMKEMAVLLESLEKTEEAEQLFREAMVLFRETCGETDQNFLDCLWKVALLVKNQGRLDEALPLYREVVERYGRVKGEMDPDTLGWLGNLGRLLWCRGFDDNELNEAGHLFREVLIGFRAVHGDTHPNSVAALKCLVHFLQDQGYDQDAVISLIHELD